MSSHHLKDMSAVNVCAGMIPLLFSFFCVHNIHMAYTDKGNVKQYLISHDLSNWGKAVVVPNDANGLEKKPDNSNGLVLIGPY